MNSFLSEDAKQFRRIAELLTLDDGSFVTATLEQSASRIGVSSDELASLIDRLSSHDSSALLQRTEDASGQELLSLTPAGHALFDRIQAFSQPFVDASLRNFRLLVSQTMITSGVLDRMLQSFRNHDATTFEIETQLPRRFSTLAAKLESGVVHCALVWGTPQRLDGVPDSVRVEVIVPNVDVVVVAHEKSIVDQVNPLAHWFNSSQVAPNAESSDALARVMSELTSYRYAALPPEAQPAAQLLPDRSNADINRIDVDTIDSALRLVRSGACDFAVLPAVYDRLEREQQDGNIVFSEPIARVPIVLVSPQQSGSGQRATLDRLLSDLRLEDSSLIWRSQRTPTDRFPRSSAFYSKLRYGYYIGADVGEAESPLQWCWQSMKLFGDAKRRRRTLQGTIINEFGNQFEITSAQFRDTFLIARVKPVGRGRKLMREFFSRFHYCDFKAGIICGTWSGNAGEERSGVFATVWSQSKLDLEELTRLMRIADLHSVMSARIGCEDKNLQVDLTADTVVPIHSDDSMYRLSDLIDQDVADQEEDF